MKQNKVSNISNYEQDLNEYKQFPSYKREADFSVEIKEEGFFYFFVSY